MAVFSSYIPEGRKACRSRETRSSYLSWTEPRITTSLARPGVSVLVSFNPGVSKHSIAACLHVFVATIKTYSRGKRSIRHLYSKLKLVEHPSRDSGIAIGKHRGEAGIGSVC